MLQVFNPEGSGPEGPEGSEGSDFHCDISIWLLLVQ